MTASRALVLGAGLQGVSAALALRRKGFDVTLVDRADGPLERASLRNEGKIHLGLVYANDPSRRTGALMLEGALAFAPIVEELVGRAIDWSAITARPFVYAVARGSQLPLDRLLGHYAWLDDEYRRRLARDGGNYLGRRPETIFRQVDPALLEEKVHPDFAAAVVATEELALDLPAFNRILAEAIGADRGVVARYGSTVTDAVRTAGGWKVSGRRRTGEEWSAEGELVVNALWDGRLALDRRLGIEPGRPWVYRLKYRILGWLPEELRSLPSLTWVLGPYGDLVNYGDGRAYLSWYPECLRGWSDAVGIPESWRAACEGELADGEKGRIAAAALEGFDAVVPGIRRTRVDAVDAGVIFSWGNSDIDDPSSELHRRHDIGVNQHGTWFSIDTGKLTTAPLFARRLAERLD